MDKNQWGQSRLNIIHVRFSWLIIQYLNQQITQSLTNNHSSLAFLLHVSISTKSSSGRYIQRHRSESSSVEGVRDLHIFDRICRVLYPQDGDSKVVRNVANFQPLCHNQEDRIAVTLVAVTNPDRSTNMWLCMNDSFPDLHCTVQSNVPTVPFLVYAS